MQQQLYEDLKNKILNYHSEAFKKKYNINSDNLQMIKFFVLGVLTAQEQIDNFGPGDATQALYYLDTFKKISQNQISQDIIDAKKQIVKKIGSQKFRCLLNFAIGYEKAKKEKHV